MHWVAAWCNIKGGEGYDLHGFSRKQDLHAKIGSSCEAITKQLHGMAPQSIQCYAPSILKPIALLQKGCRIVIQLDC